MKTLHAFTAILCVMLLLAPMSLAQEQHRYSWQETEHSWATDPYRPKTIPEVNLANSDRLDKLVRAGRLYLSLNDTIALALENNLDIEVSRYTPQIAQADLLRASAGGLLRGVPQTVQTGADSVDAQATGTAGGATAGVRTSSTSSNATGGTGADTTATEAGGAVITQTGVATPVLDPQLFFRYAFRHTTTPQSNTITTGGVSSFILDNQGGNFGAQKSFLTGTTASFGWNSNYSTTNNLASTLNPYFSGNLQLQVTQRLLQGFGRAVNNRNIRIAKNNIRVGDLVFEEQVIATVASVVKLYWDMVSFAEDVKVKQQALALADKLYNDNKKQVEIGTLAPIEIVSAQAQVARRQQELTASETNLLQQETILKNVLSKNGVESPMLASARIVPTDRIKIPEQEQVRPINDLVEAAMKRREVEQTRINIDNTKIGMAGSKSALLPSLDFQGFFNNNALSGEQNYLNRPGITPPADSFFLGGFGSGLGQLLRRNFPDYGLAFQLSIPIHNRSAQADYIRDSLSLRQQELRQRAQLNNIRVQVQNSQIAVTQARALYDAAVQERILQEQTLDAEQKKYALGASTVFFVIQYQRDLAQAQSNEVAALATYAKAKVDLDVATGKTLETYNVQIEEALAGKISRPPDPIPAVQE